MKSDQLSHRKLMARSRYRGGVVRSALFLGIFLVALITLSWMVALPTVIGFKIEKDTGYKWDAEVLTCNPFGFEFLLEGGFLRDASDTHEGRPVLAIRYLKVTGPVDLLLSGDSSLDKVELDLERITLIRDESGTLNLESILTRILGVSKALGDELPIAECHLKIDTVEILDYASASKPSRKALRLGIDADGFEAKDAIGLFGPLFEIISRAEYLPDEIADSGYKGTNMAQARRGGSNEFQHTLKGAGPYRKTF